MTGRLRHRLEWWRHSSMLILIACGWATLAADGNPAAGVTNPPATPKREVRAAPPVPPGSPAHQFQQRHALSTNRVQAPRQEAIAGREQSTRTNAPSRNPQAVAEERAAELRQKQKERALTTAEKLELQRLEYLLKLPPRPGVRSRTTPQESPSPGSAASDSP